MTDERRSTARTSAATRPARASASSAPRRPPRPWSAATSPSAAAATSPATAIVPPRPPPMARARCSGSRSAPRQIPATSSGRPSREPDLRAGRAAPLDRAAHRAGPADPSRGPCRRRDESDDVDDWTSVRHGQPPVARRRRRPRRPRGLRGHAVLGAGRASRPSAPWTTASGPPTTTTSPSPTLTTPAPSPPARCSRRPTTPIEPGYDEWVEEAARTTSHKRPPAHGASPTTDHQAQRVARTSGGDRDMGVAAAVGIGFLGVALILFNIGPAAAMVLVTAVIGLASAEFFGVLRKVGYEPVTLAGIVGSVGLVLGAYNNGTAILPSVLFLTTAVCLLWYLVGAGDRGPGDERRGHAARRPVGGAVRLLRRAHARLGRPRHRHPPGGHPRHRRLRRRGPVHRRATPGVSRSRRPAPTRRSRAWSAGA